MGLQVIGERPEHPLDVFRAEGPSVYLRGGQSKGLSHDGRWFPDRGYRGSLRLTGQYVIVEGPSVAQSGASRYGLHTQFWEDSGR